MTTRRLASGLLAVVAAASVSACGAGLEAQTYQQRIQGSATDASTGELQLRNVAVEAPPSYDGYEIGDDAEVAFTVVNRGDEADRLVEVTSPAAREVVVRANGAERDLVAPPNGTTGDAVRLELRGLTRPLQPGEYVELTFRFADNGTAEVLVPVALTGDTDRPVYTGERFEGGEEPALQAPAGGHHGEDQAH